LCKNETKSKHSFFSCFNLLKKWNHIQVYSSIVSHVSSLCKNETIPILPLVIVIFINQFLLDEPWFFYSMITISLVDHTLSLACFTFPEEHLWWVVLLANLLTFTCFEQFHHNRNLFLSFYTTCSSKWSNLLAPFRLQKYENNAKH